MTLTDTSIPKNPTKSQIPEWRVKLHDRLIPDSVIDRAGMLPSQNDPGWYFPFRPNDLIFARFKGYPGSEDKALWYKNGRRGHKPDDARFYDPAGDLAEQVARASGVLILCEGEPDVWSLWAAGIFNATCTMMGGGNLPAWFTAELLADYNAQKVLTFPDLDNTGRSYVQKIASQLNGSGIALDCRQLPADLGEKADINDLLKRTGAAGLWAALESCPVMELPDEPPAPAPVRTYRRADYATVAGESYNDYFDRAILSDWLKGQKNAKGFYDNFCCPFHAEKKPSAGYNPESRVIHCFVCGDHGREEIALYLGILTKDEWAAERRCSAYNNGNGSDRGFLGISENDTPLGIGCAKSAENKRSPLELLILIDNDEKPDSIQETNENAPDETRFSHGLPYTLSKRLRNAHFKIAVNRQHAADLIWLVYQEIPDSILPHDQPFTAYAFQKATEQIGRNVSRDTVETGLDQLTAWGVNELCYKCDLPYSEDQIVRSQKSHNSPGRPAAKLYRFLPIDQQVANFLQHYRALCREDAFKSTPSDVQPEWGDFTPDEIRLLDELRQPIYEQFAPARQAAQHQLDRHVGYLDSAAENISRGTYRAVELSPGEIPNARAYTRALHRQIVTAAGGEKEEAYKDQYELGISRSTAARVRTDNQVITVERSKVIPLDQVTDYQRENCLVLEELDGGQVRVRTASAEKFVDQADENEREKYRALCDRQRERRNKHASEDEKQAIYHAPPLPDCIPADYSDRFLYAQLDFTPGAFDLSVYDPETGEKRPPKDLWRMLVDRAKEPVNVPTSAQSEVVIMPFAEYSEPKEQELIADSIPSLERQPAPARAARPASQRNRPIFDYGGAALVTRIEVMPGVWQAFTQAQLDRHHARLAAAGD